MGTIILTLVIITAVSIMAIAFGYNITLPGYSRDKLLSGISVWSQQCCRQVIGEKIMWLGLVILIVAVMIGAILGLFATVRYEYSTYKKIDVIHVQNRSFVMADGLWNEIDHKKYHWIDDDYPGIFFQKGFSTFGFEMHAGFKIVDIEGELYDYDYPPDDEESDDG